MAFQKRELIDLKWDKVGQGVGGWLTRMERAAFDGKPNVLYNVTNQAGAITRFFGTIEINDKLTPADLGATVLITFTGEKPLSGGRTRKVFEVMVDSDPATRLAGFGFAAPAAETPVRPEPPIEAYEAA